MDRHVDTRQPRNSSARGALEPSDPLPHCRVLSCVGAGGVGKTTVAAALGFAAARAGSNVACLTIDPARRLASSLGLRSSGAAASHVDPAVFGRAPGAPQGSLVVMMLDSKQTFDALVRERAPSREVCERIFKNRVYQHMSSHLAGIQSYMAMETVLRVMADPRFDLLVLDTPPTNHALDFFAAPAKLTETLDSATLGWLVEAFGPESRAALGLLTRGARLVLRGLSRVTGGGFLEQVAEFIFDFNELFGGFRKHAEAVAEALRGSNVSYLVVTTPEPAPASEALLLTAWLREQGMLLGGLIANRCQHPLPDAVSDAELRAALVSRGLALPEHKVRTALESALERRKREQALLLDLEKRAGSVTSVRLPSSDGDGFGIAALSSMAERLASELALPLRL